MIKLGELVIILDLHRQGLSVSAISRQCGLDRKTVRRYIERGLEPPAYGPRKPRPTLLDPLSRPTFSNAWRPTRGRVGPGFCGS